LITFHFACYGAGTPRFDEYAHCATGRRQLTPRSFIARLPQRLLAGPSRGALAVVAHIDRVWSYSFDWPQAPQQLNVFTSTFGRLFDGYPIGAAMEPFNQRYAELSSDLSSEIEEVKYGGEPDFLNLPGLWTANNDARSYVVLGDPAVRLTTL
jgi:carboxylesterase type B